MDEINLREDCFSHRQLYVACFTVSYASSLVILALKGHTENVVHNKVFQ